MISLGVELGKKHPDLADPLMQEAMMNVDIEEPISQNELGVRNQKLYCEWRCREAQTNCKRSAGGWYTAELAGCYFLTGPAIPACLALASFHYGVMLRTCDDNYNFCRNGC